HRVVANDATLLVQGLHEQVAVGAALPQEEGVRRVGEAHVKDGQPTGFPGHDDAAEVVVVQRALQVGAGGREGGSALAGPTVGHAVDAAAGREVVPTTGHIDTIV